MEDLEKLNVLIRVAELAQKNGLLTLEDAVLVYNCSSELTETLANKDK